MFESIKAERKLSFNNWRYRLLHWAFCIDPATPAESTLPRFLYTHYCPLFHLTNMIAILSPFIAVVKLIVFFAYFLIGFMVGVAGVLNWMYEKIQPYLPEFKWERLPPPAAPAPSDLGVFTLKRKRKLIEYVVVGYDFAEYWKDAGQNTGIPKEKLEAIYVSFQEQRAAAVARAAARREAFRKRMVFWVNFSRVFIKFALNVFYVLVAGLVGYAFYKVGIPIIVWSFKGLLSVSLFDWIMATTTASIWVINSLILATIAYSIVRLAMASPPIAHKSTQILGTVFSPVKYLCESFCDWVGGMIESACSFIAMFYEENCPQVTIVTEEEEALHALGEM